MRISDLRYQIDRDHETRAQHPNPLGTPKRHRIPKLRYKLRGHRVTEWQEGKYMAKATEKKEKKAKVQKPEMWGAKDMANKLKIEAKRLRVILRDAGKGVAANGELGRYEWKPNDAEAIAKVKKIVDAYEEKAAARKEKAEKKAKKAPKKAAKASKAKAKKSPKNKPAVEETEEEAAGEEETFENADEPEDEGDDDIAELA